MKPKISIICPILNVDKYIETTLKSVVVQTYQNWELLVMDGGSKDRTKEIVSSYAKKDQRIKLFSEPDEGPWHATDKGIDLAQGDFISIIGGQDGFLDREWLARCIKILNADRSVSLVWGSSRGMREDGEFFPEKHITYSHLMGEDSSLDNIWFVLVKIFSVIKELLLSTNEKRKKILFKKIFSKTAILRVNFLTKRNFPNGKIPQKEDWFLYWLNTGLTFTDQGTCISKKVYLNCAPKYPMGSRLINHMTDFNFNFNSKGYLSYYIPTLAVFGREHRGNSGERVEEELFQESEKYTQKVLALKKEIMNHHVEMVFVDRDAVQVSKRKF